MRERDLRKQALESGKTVSRAARSKLNTPSSSRANSATPSRVGSRVPSRNVSDDEDGLSDTTQWSSASIDEMLSPTEEKEEAPEIWTGILDDRINEICDRKRSSMQGREEALQGFAVLLTRHYALEQLRGKTDELVTAMLKSVKAAQSEREVALALKALALLLVTDPSDAVYDALAGPVKTCISDSQHSAAKVAGIHCLGVATFYGGASLEETAETMEFFLDIVSSDGALVEETDNGEVVTAAIEEWGFLATQIEDMEDATEAAMDTFVDQLESANPEVQIAAGDAIALLYEKSYTDAESDDEPAEDSDDDSDDVNNHRDGPRMIKRYTVYRQQHLLLQTLTALSKASSKRLSKKDRKQLHMTFTDILHTVEKPTRGPRYSTALDEDGREMGSRMKVAVYGGGRMTIDRWWKLQRMNGLKRLLGEGFLVHFQGNPVVFEGLPVFVEEG
ncbi:hypothetical protein LTR62_001530 [Meristemomyces frigidus]|uniref:Interferon-related developmental regulator N-terminal domain-containing protein n=1 Tax=Meristemomyces frigidus TaxID=1508187 RepID=A0AAN7TN55_9PEZI|nr:hypothetical protein LTR62_001530 [Meristemomyces frigidus]